ncbi:MAG: NADH-quinone oxidoreductase subunit J [Chloroflexota bacterium]|nr:NADH-quinone oxidoreductase subunit J [Chloroflexota bacterium]
MNGVIEWIIFLALSIVAIVTAAGMILTMSMYRAGLALMASFVALAGLFILLNADLLAAIQIMMNVGGMLVMVLFMVMTMMDPGGEMMWGMKRDMHMPGPGAFSMHMPSGKPPVEKAPPEQEQPDMDIPQMGSEGHIMNMSHDEMNMSGMTPRQYYEMMVDMAMSTAQLPWAIALGIASAFLLIVLMIQTPWPLSSVGPTQDATNAVGNLLLSRYMIAFEGAAFLILAGIAGAVIFAKRERTPVLQSEPKEVTSEHIDDINDAHKQVYTCPIHPEVQQHQSGNCPQCGRNLVPENEMHSSSSQSTQGGQA